MTSDAVPLRIERVRPIRPVPVARHGTDLPTLPPDPASAIEPIAAELDGDDDDSPFAEAWGRLRVWWDQTTFYLFSADSWRR
jgi:hypothetical protein